MGLTFIIPMTGLMVDVGVLYVVRARLQSSVDGAALAAARALNLGQTTASQATSAKQNAVNWFYSNFPTGNWTTSGTQMSASDVLVFDDASNPQLRNVTVSGRTVAPTFFMKWFGANAVTVLASGNASRRDVVVMMILDRSGSMNNVGACDDMRLAAKLFTGQFAAGRDRIGLVSFSDNVYTHTAPTTNFQSVLGYSNGFGSGSGAIDNITCQGGTSTAQAISVAYNELYRANLPGALNVLMFETDGLPNTLTMNFWDSAANVAGIKSTSNCTDNNGKKKSAGGFNTLASLPSWTDGATLPSGSYFPNPPAGIIGAIASDDPGGQNKFFHLMEYWTTSTSNNFNSTDYIGNGTGETNDALGCSFKTTQYVGSFPDLAWFPTADIWGNSLYPASNPYQSVIMDGSHISSATWANYRDAVLNATDNSAYRARTNGTIPAYFFGVGLGGTATNPPDFVLLQRMANDPGGDDFNSPARYAACTSGTGCINYANQPQGTFIYSTSPSSLNQAFLALSSQILRLSR